MNKNDTFDAFQIALVGYQWQTSHDELGCESMWRLISPHRQVVAIVFLPSLNGSYWWARLCGGHKSGHASFLMNAILSVEDEVAESWWFRWRRWFPRTPAAK